jgi:hypothetical protein
VTHTSSTVPQFLICHDAAEVKPQTLKLPYRIITLHPSLPNGFGHVKGHSHCKHRILYSQYDDTCNQQDSNTVHCDGKQETKLNGPRKDTSRHRTGSDSTPGFQYNSGYNVPVSTNVPSNGAKKRCIPAEELSNTISALHYTSSRHTGGGGGGRHATPHTRSPTGPLLSVLRHSTGDN